MPENARLQRYVAMNLGGFYAWDVVQNVFWADETFARIMGFSLEELNGGLPAERMMSRIHDEDRPHVMQGIQDSVLSGQSFEMIYRVRRGDGFVKITEVGKCYRYVDGVATLFSGVVFESCPQGGEAVPSNVNEPQARLLASPDSGE